MVSSVQLTQDQFLADLATYINIPVIEQGIPDVFTVRRNEDDMIEPYVAVQMSPPQQGAKKSFAGPKGDDYYLIFSLQVVAADPSDARYATNLLISALLGKSDFPWGGSVRQRTIGNILPIVTTDGATEAYQFPSSWSLLIQYGEE